MQRKLARLAHSPGEDAQGQPGQNRAAKYGSGGSFGPGCFPNVRNMEGVQPCCSEVICLGEQIQNGDQESNVADAGDDERFLGCGSRSGTFMPEADQQVGRHTHQLPEHIELDDIGRQHQPQHGSSEQRHVGVVTGEARVTLHITEGVDLHQ